MKRKFKKLSKLLAIGLSFSIMASVIPMQVFATDYINHQTLTTLDNETESLTIQEEIVEERDEFSKTYLMENGVYCSVTSASPVHELVNNEWENINSSIEDTDFTTIDQVQSYMTSSLTNTENGLVDVATMGISLSELTSNSELTTGDAVLTPDTFGIIKVNVYPTYTDDFPKPIFKKTEVTIDADLTLACNSSESNPSIQIQPIYSSWRDSEDQYYTLCEDFYENPVIDYNASSSGGDYIWDITSEYVKMENGTSNNCELLLSTNDTASVFITGGLVTRYYRIIDNNDVGFTYHTVDMGRAGTAYINDYTNVFFINRDELSVDCNILPVSITRFISNNTADHSFGAGGRWNYESRLTKVVGTYIWDMFNGSSIRFQNTGEVVNGKEKWEEYLYNREGYTLWVTPNTTGQVIYNNVTITDDEGYIYAFNEYGYVTSVTSPYNSDDNLTINYAGNTIVSIKDGIGRVYTFNQEQIQYINVISSITTSFPDDSENSISVNYNYQIMNNKAYLTSVEYPDNKTVEYSYDTIGRLVSMKNIDGSILEFTYAITADVADKTNSPVYRDRISSYRKKFPINSEEYITDFLVTIDASYPYHRVFTQSNAQNEIVLTESIQYNRDLDTLYMTDSLGNSYYADYDDSHQLISLITPENTENLIVNGDLNKAKRGNRVPQHWDTYNISDANGSSDSAMLEHFSSNNLYVKITNSATLTRMLTQKVSIDGIAGDKYAISAWGSGYSTLPREDHFWGVRILAKNNNLYEEIHTMAFDSSLWNKEQTRLTGFALPFDTDELVVQLVTDHQLGEVCFDDIYLYQPESAYVASVDDVPNEGICACDDCENQNCTCSCANSSECECISCDIKNTVTRNEHGNITQDILTNGNKNIVSTNEYIASSNYLSKHINENNVETSYNYSLTNGLLLSETIAEDASIQYGYNAIGALTSVSQSVNNIEHSIEYSYNNDQIESISHNGYSYDYDYDVFGNVTSISINDSPLVSYSYNNDYQRSLGSITYSDGNSLSYSYDSNGNITEIYHNNDTEPMYTYEYDIYNNLVEYTDNANQTVTSYDKTIGEKHYEMVVQRLDADATIIYGIEESSSTSYVESIFGRDYSITDTTSFDAITGNIIDTVSTPIIAFNETGKATVTTTSDSLKRKIAENLKFTTDIVGYENASITVKNEYTYKDVSASQTTKLVETFKATWIMTDENNITTTRELINLKYKYDSLGRITTVYEYRNSSDFTGYYPIALYQYDAFGQLIAEGNGFNNEIWAYEYDEGGNITAKKQLRYSDVIVEDIENPAFQNLDSAQPIQTITYGYDSVWKDRLISYNNKTISYDDMGNPNAYHGDTVMGETDMNLTWEGRSLVKATSQDNSHMFEYTYDANGLRTQKTMYEGKTFTIETVDSNGNTITEEKFEFVKNYCLEYVWSDQVVVGYKLSTFTPKKINGYYVMDGAEVVVEESDTSITVKPIYNNLNEPLGVNCYAETDDGNISSETFYYIKDAQGNVREIHSLENDYAIGLNYDSFGNYSLNLVGGTIDSIENSISNANGEVGTAVATILGGLVISIILNVTFTSAPFAYRGYIYDVETGLYYCQSRYYSPSWGRFINADDVTVLEMAKGDIHSANLFAYCGNDPVNRIDTNGYYFTSIQNNEAEQIMDSNDMQFKNYFSFSKNIVNHFEYPKALNKGTRKNKTK